MRAYLDLLLVTILLTVGIGVLTYLDAKGKRTGDVVTATHTSEQPSTSPDRPAVAVVEPR